MVWDPLKTSVNMYHVMISLTKEQGPYHLSFGNFGNNPT